MTARTTKHPDPPGRRLREIHALGRQLAALGRKGGQSRYGSRWIEREAKKRGLPVPTVRNFILFAERYDQAELKELCAECLLEGYELSFGHVVRLLAVRSTSRRQSIQRAALRGHWSIARLNLELRRRGATPDLRDRQDESVESAGYVRGKPPWAVRGVNEFRAQVAMDAARWRRIVEWLKRQTEIDPADRPSGTRDHLSSKDLDRPLLGALVHLVAAWDKLEKRASTQIDSKFRGSSRVRPKPVPPQSHRTRHGPT